jgi:Cytochrome P460
MKQVTKKLLAGASLVVSVVLIVSCAQTQTAPATFAKLMKDGDLTVPADYKSWPTYLSEVQRPDVKQVRELYINSIGAKATAGGAFPDGTISVMELYKAKEGADGTLMKNADGKLVKGDLLKVYVMGKGKGWGETAPAGLKNGDWVYSAYLADGKTTSPDPAVSCRACHLPLGESKDYIHRYDEYFQKRKS